MYFRNMKQGANRQNEKVPLSGLKNKFTERDDWYALDLFDMMVDLSNLLFLDLV